MILRMHTRGTLEKALSQFEAATCDGHLRLGLDGHVFALHPCQVHGTRRSLAVPPGFSRKAASPQPSMVAISSATVASTTSSRARNRSCSPVCRPPLVASNRYVPLRIDPSRESEFSIRRNPPLRDRKKIDPGTQFRQNPSLEIAEFPLINQGILGFSQTTSKAPCGDHGAARRPRGPSADT